MSTHPNAILMCILTPENLSRKTMEQILKYYKVEDDNDIKIGDKEYFYNIMEENYCDCYQVSAKDGDLVFLNMITYGYGENITWNELEKQKNELEVWAQEVCNKFNCFYEIVVTANYW